MSARESVHRRFYNILLDNEDITGWDEEKG